MNTSTPERPNATCLQRLSSLQSNIFIYKWVHMQWCIWKVCQENSFTHPCINLLFTYAHLWPPPRNKLVYSGQQLTPNPKGAIHHFQQRTKAKSLECWLTFQPLHTWLHHSSAQWRETDNRITSCAKSKDVILSFPNQTLSSWEAGSKSTPTWNVFESQEYRHNSHSNY